MENDSVSTATAKAPPALKLRSGNYSNNRTLSTGSTSFRVDEGYSDETKSQAENDGVGDISSLPTWIHAHTETERAEIAFSLLKTLQTSTISKVVDRLTPFLHMDPVLKLPPEITAEIFSYLDPVTLLTASLASRPWRSRILDSRLWRGLYITQGWRLNVEEIQNIHRQRGHIVKTQSRKSRTRRSDTEGEQPKHKRRVPPGWVSSNRLPQPDEAAAPWAEISSPGSSGLGSPPDAEGDYEMHDVNSDDFPPRKPSLHANELPYTSRPIPTSALPASLSFGTLYTETEESRFQHAMMSNNEGIRLNWAYLYKQRRKLEENWQQGRFTNFQLPHRDYPSEAHRECIYVLQFVGKWLVSGSRDKTIRIWDLETRRLRGRPLVGHTKSVLCLQFDPSEEEDIIISGSSDRSVIIWRFSTGEKVYELNNAHLDSVLNLRFDKRFLVTCSKDKTIKIWNRNVLQPTDKDYPRISNRPGPRFPSYIVDTSIIPPSALEAQMANRQVKTLSPYTLLMTLDGHGAAVNAIQIDNDEIVSASGDRLIKVWNLHNGACLKTLVGHHKGIACVQFDSQRIVSGSNDDTVRIYDHVSGAEVACLQGHQDLVRTVQAGFGDPPGSKETLRLEAMAVDNDYFEAHRRGDIDLNSIQPTRRSIHHRSTGSRLPKDIMALGAKLPPGGGGSRWARIVSGSYDESIIIWTRDKEGKWVIGQRLRQEDAVRAASTAMRDEPPNDNELSNSEGPHRQAPHAMPATYETKNDETTIPTQQNQQHLAGPVNMNHAPLPPQNTPNPPHPGAGQQPPPHAPGHPTARIFKLQFDARKLVCASQDHRIVGWDFAAGDKDLEEACRFFAGL